MEFGAYWSAGGLLAAETRHEPGLRQRSCLCGGSCRWPRAHSPAIGPPVPQRRGLKASGPLGRCALVYVDDCQVRSPMLEQNLLDEGELRPFPRPKCCALVLTTAQDQPRRRGFPDKARRQWQAAPGGVREPQADCSRADFTGARPRAAGGGPDWSMPCGCSDTTC